MVRSISSIGSRPAGVCAVEYVREALNYNAESGVVSWNERRPLAHFSNRKRNASAFATQHGGRPAGSVNNHGYIIIKLGQQQFGAHRLAWVLANGRWPDGDIDHINGDRTDNRITNLREVSVFDNARNQKLPRTNKSGRMGVVAYKGHWRAQIQVNGKVKTLGEFHSFEKACAVRAEAEHRFGYHPNHGRTPAALTSLTTSTKGTGDE